MKRRSKRILKIVYLAVLFLATLLVGYLFTRENPPGRDFFSILAKINPFWFLAAVLAMVVYWMSEAWVLNYITAFMYRRESYWHSLKMNMIGQYYSALTPFGHGQPVQVAYMGRDGMPVGIATFILTLKFIIYELIIVVYCLIFMIARIGYYYTHYPEVFWFTIAGIGINLVIVMVVIFAVLCNAATKKAVLGITKFLSKIKIIKNSVKAAETVGKTLDDFHESSKYLKDHKPNIVIAALITMVQYIAFFLIPYFLYVAFGFGLLSGKPSPIEDATPFTEALDLVVMAAFLYLAVCFFPTPGAAGANETGFGIFFSRFMGGEWAVAMFLWRLITYYSNILIGFLIIFIDGFARRHPRQNIPESKKNLITKKQ